MLKTPSRLINNQGMKRKISSVKTEEMDVPMIDKQATKIKTEVKGVTIIEDKTEDIKIEIIL